MKFARLVWRLLLVVCLLVLRVVAALGRTGARRATPKPHPLSPEAQFDPRTSNEWLVHHGD